MAHPEPTAHSDGFRVRFFPVTTPPADVPTTAIVLDLVVGGVATDSVVLYAAADDTAGRATLSRVFPICEAIAAYFNFGGKAELVAALVGDFVGLGMPALPPGVVHVVTSVAATRTHVLRREAEGDYLYVVDGKSTRVLSHDEASRLCRGELPLEDDAGDDEDDGDWSFLDEMRADPDDDADEDDE